MLARPTQGYKMAGYTKEFLLDAYLSRYIDLEPFRVDLLYRLAETLYDRVGRDKFRVYASLDAEALRVYKAKLKPAKNVQSKN